MELTSKRMFKNKGKPGTARPANVTAHILPDQQLNKIENGLCRYNGKFPSIPIYCGICFL